MKKLFGGTGGPAQGDRKRKIGKPERKDAVLSAKFRFLNQFMYESESGKLAAHFRERRHDFLDVS